MMAMRGDRKRKSFGIWTIGPDGIMRVLYRF